MGADAESVSQHESELKSAHEYSITFVAGPLGLGFDYDAVTKEFHVTAVRGQAQAKNIGVGDTIILVGDLPTDAHSSNAPHSLGELVRVISSAPRPFNIRFQRREDALRNVRLMGTRVPGS